MKGLVDEADERVDHGRILTGRVRLDVGTCRQALPLKDRSLTSRSQPSSTCDGLNAVRRFGCDNFLSGRSARRLPHSLRCRRARRCHQRLLDRLPALALPFILRTQCTVPGHRRDDLDSCGAFLGLVGRDELLHSVSQPQNRPFDPFNSSFRVLDRMQNGRESRRLHSHSLA